MTNARGGLRYELRDVLKKQEELCAKESTEGNEAK
jgi:hypothetical protein